ncbi:unnamed protein product [Arctia plantaginis]|uniref:Uncharacterized protein n=1 Tax=Arctia plantaginis TaxID=874455 RepID=A0A8S0Z5Z1_ARCPL|nr:unnamed protein product [Arctia plantaginis]
MLLKHYKEALQLWPSYASAHNNLGTLVLHRAELNTTFCKHSSTTGIMSTHITIWRNYTGKRTVFQNH